ncbi:hypothetical protein FB639_005510 [Coemansia asiatica]|nr:hypothetical protein FB639_005510 [Coemansia asiatica]
MRSNLLIIATLALYASSLANPVASKCNPIVTTTCTIKTTNPNTSSAPVIESTIQTAASATAASESETDTTILSEKSSEAQVLSADLNGGQGSKSFVADSILSLSTDLLTPQKNGQSELRATSQENNLLAILAAYSGAAYTVTDSWNCRYACQYPGTQGTVVEYNWSFGFPRSAGYIASNPNTSLLVVAFQGTENTAQWMDNLDIEQVSWPESIDGSRVHRGFLRGYLDARDQVMDNLRALAQRYPDYNIAIVGHSLGGARATLALLDISIEMPELVPRLGLYTQGQPRVGNKSFADAINAIKVPKSREVYEYDIATRLPFLSMGYFHHETELWVHNNETELCINPTEVDGCSDNGNAQSPLNTDDHFRYPGLRYK